MRKVTKILGKVLSAAVLLLIVLPLALSLLLSINAVQNFVVDRAAQFASRKLETVVRIDRVDIGIFDRITLEGLYVEDYGGDTLLYVGKLHAFITQFGIFSNGFTLRHGRLTDGKFYLREMPDGVMNVKQIVSRMGRKEKKEESDFRLSISALTVENLEFRLEKLQHRNPVYGIDFSDMDIRDIDAVIDNFTIDGGAVGAEIGRFSAREKSGFEIDDFGGKFFLANGCIGMENARLVTPHSNVSIPAVSIVGDSWAEYKEYVDRVSMTVEVRNSMLSSDDVAYFSPKLRDWRLTLRNINLLFDGVVSDFNADLKSLSFGRSSRVHARGRVTGLSKIDDTHFSLTFDDVTTEAADLGQIAANVARKELLAKMSAMIDRAGALRLTGEVEGVKLYHDYGHNPTEMRNVLSVARLQPHGRLWAVMQPHTYSRVKRLFDDYLTCTQAADFTLVTDIYAAREKDPGDIRASQIVEGMRAHGVDAVHTPTFDDTEAYLRAHWQPGDLVLTMGCGNINQLNDQIWEHEQAKETNAKC